MERLAVSFGHAWRGIRYVIKHEKNARIHLVFAVVVLILGLVLGITNRDLAAILMAVIIVFFAEIMNTAFEKTLDLVQPNHHPQVKLIKDMAAGAVLVTAVVSAAIGIVIFTPYLVGLWPR